MPSSESLKSPGFSSSIESAYSYWGEISIRRPPPALSASETAPMARCAAGVMVMDGCLTSGALVPNSANSSPLACSSLTMSQPPTNSPLT